jgi:UDP-sulfoquinovose synthase
MRILILGIDGYLGWALANTLTKENIEVFGIDSFFRRKWVKEMNSLSAVPIGSMNNRIKSYKKIFNKEIVFYKGDITNYNFLSSKIKEIKPDVIVHFAQCPSAPYSMMNQEKSAWVQSNNLIGTLNLIYAVKEHVPEAHIIKLGTMGEYGTPNIDIAEGFFEIEYRGRKDVLPFPRQANSWYHLSKVHDSNNLQFACRNYGIRCTDIMQGVVFGFYPGENNIDKQLYTRLDFDQAFGTSINRFCCESVISHAITVYGDGTQSRSFLPLRDSMKCIELVIKNPPRLGEYKVVNQFANVHSINDLALKVAGVCKQLNMDVNVVKMKNPRKEAALHYYNPDNQNLKNLGYNPTTDFEQEILALIQGIKPYKKRIQLHSNILNPTIKW